MFVAVPMPILLFMFTKRFCVLSYLHCLVLVYRVLSIGLHRCTSIFYSMIQYHLLRPQAIIIKSVCTLKLWRFLDALEMRRT